MIETDEHQLIQAAQTGDQEAFSQVFDLFYPRLLRFVLRKTEGNQALSEDIVSETFVKALKHLHQFKSKEGTSTIAWFYRIADNELKMFWRKNNRYSFEALEEHPELRCDHADIIDHIVSLEQSKFVSLALEQLNERDKEIIQKHYFQYIPLIEIANEHNEKHTTVKARIHRARKKLKKIIIEMQPDAQESITSNR